MLAELRNVTKRYRAGDPPVLNGCNLQVAEGETVAIVGPSGSGKSTLLNMLGALDRPDSGQVEVAGMQLGNLAQDSLSDFRNTTVGFIFQLHHLLPQCTVLENVLIPTLARKRSGELKDRAYYLMQALGLTRKAQNRPGELSGGERQRAAVARALICNPKLLLADEPTGALDQENAAGMADLLTELNQREKTTIVMVTHAPDLARRMGRMLELRQGQLTSI